jgi:hypothetical protein
MSPLPSRRFVTSEGVKGSSTSQRRFIVVSRATAKTVYRTDDRAKALAFQRKRGAKAYEAFDLRPQSSTT